MINTTQPNKIPVTDARPGDRFTFIANEGGERFAGMILARDENLVQVRWGDGHESWTPLVVDRGTVEVHRRDK